MILNTSSYAVGFSNFCICKLPILYIAQFYFIKKIFLMFIYFWDRERQIMSGGGAERETQNLMQAPGSKLSAQSPTWGWNSRTVRSWPELKSDTLTDWAIQVPPNFLFNRCHLEVSLSSNFQLFFRFGGHFLSLSTVRGTDCIMMNNLYPALGEFFVWQAHTDRRPCKQKAEGKVGDSLLEKDPSHWQWMGGCVGVGEGLRNEGF